MKRFIAWVLDNEYEILGFIFMLTVSLFVMLMFFKTQTPQL